MPSVIFVRSEALGKCYKYETTDVELILEFRVTDALLRGTRKLNRQDLFLKD
jgi:hypothetical protein